MRGQLSFAIVFILLAVLFAFIFAVATPTIIQMITSMYQNAESVLQGAEETAMNIQDENVQTAVVENIQAAKDSTVQQIDILTAFYQYGWAIVLIASALVITILARRVVEYSRGGIA